MLAHPLPAGVVKRLLEVCLGLRLLRPRLAPAVAQRSV